MPRRNLFAFAIVGIVSALCWQNSRGARPEDEMMELYGIFVDAVEQVEANYVRPVDRRELLESALQGMLQELDPHSAYFSESHWSQFKKQIDGSFSGIGIRIDVAADTGRLKIVAPLVGSPAYAAGIRAGDQVLEIDGKATEGMSTDQAIEALQGRPGTEVSLTVLHPGSDKTETLTMQRSIIEVESVLGDLRKPDDTWDFMLDKDRKIAYIRINSFIHDTAEDLGAALEELTADGMQGLILDLRDNPGGLLPAAIEVSDLFVEDGKIVSTRGRNTRDRAFEAEEEGTFTGFPMVVLINEHSASAAEIVSACLQDHGRAKVVGERSFGKGSVQNIIPLDNGKSVLKLTTQTYWRPSGKNIHRFKGAPESEEWGVSPDEGLAVEVDGKEYRDWFDARRQRDLISAANPADPEDAKRPEDRQLDKALEVIEAEL